MVEDYRITRQRLLKAGPEMTAYIRQLVEEEGRERAEAESVGGATVVTDDDGESD